MLGGKHQQALGFGESVAFDLDFGQSAATVDTLKVITRYNNILSNEPYFTFNYDCEDPRFTEAVLFEKEIDPGVDNDLEISGLVKVS